MNPAQSELNAALKDQDSLLRWLGLRGYEVLPSAPQLPKKQTLAGALHLHAPGYPAAPTLLCLWGGKWTEQALLGSDLRARQRDANEYRQTLRGSEFRSSAPALCVVACPEFLAAFPLDDDPFARRLRFTYKLLERDGSPLRQQFQSFRAGTFATWARASDADPDGILAELGIEDSGERSWDFSKLFVGVQLDAAFVQFMADERGRIARLLLEPEHRTGLLTPLWRALGSGFTDGISGDVVPTPQRIARERRLRGALFATIDTVLLRLVLYRYLEAQFGYRIPAEEQRGIALGTYDEPAKEPTYDQIVEQTVRVDSAKKEARRKKQEKPQDKQLVFFATADKPADFVREIKARADWYQREAGGDLHQGAVAEAADVLQGYLLDKLNAVFAELLAGTSTTDYSFSYADLDALAFQQFYVDTIGTDLRVSYDPQTRKASVEVVDFERNRKEQGAYYTSEKLSQWLVDRTLGRLYRGWAEEFREFLVKQGHVTKGRLPAVRGYLDRLLGWRIIDPTCGGGIFLRAAFEFLSRVREPVKRLLDHLPTEARRDATKDGPYQVFAEDAASGEWEWHILLHMLYGVDVDVKAINIASNLLTLSALTYKRNGICFPSFINTSLKPGNALLNPLRPEDRGEFLGRHRARLGPLMELRRQLRDPELPRAEWRRLHAEAAKLVQPIVQEEIVRAYGAVFGSMDQRALVQRVQRVGVFLYEAEFPEAYFEVRDGVVCLRMNPGFDVVIGNPPWEEPAAELKQFLPEFDPEYLSLSGPESKKRETALLGDKEISKRWSDFTSSINDYKALLSSGWYQHQRRQVRGRIPAAPANLFKYAVEMSWHLLRELGAGGLVLDSGLWSSLAACGLRSLLIDRSSSVCVCGFTNSERLFPDVDARVRFSATTFCKGGRTDALRAIFMCRDFGELERFDQVCVEIPCDGIRNDPRDSYPVPEVRSKAHYESERGFLAHACLGEEPWLIDAYSREFHASEHRAHFLPHREGCVPLVQGNQFNLFGVQFGDVPEYWVDPKDREIGGFLRRRQESRIIDAIVEYIEADGEPIKGGKRNAALDWVRARTGSREVPDSWIRLDWEGYRLSWRDLVRNDDRRTLISAIVPRNVALTHTVHFIRPLVFKIDDGGITWKLQFELPALLYLAGCVSSFTCDSKARSLVAQTHFQQNLFKSLPVPPWREAPLQVRVAELTARLTCLPVTKDRPWADYGDLAAAVGLSPKQHGLVDPAARREAEVELNALVARLYGLGRKEFRFLMDTLFMTPKHKATHAALRDDISARL